MFRIHDWIQRFLPRDGIVVEAGTADGHDTVWFAQHFNEGKIYGFEPYTKYFEITKKHTESFPNVELSPFALDAEDGVKELFISDLSGELWGSSSLLKPKDHLELFPQITFKQTQKVQTINLDTWFASKGSPDITLLWLDMQGNEPNVLMHAPNILAKTKYLYTEVSYVETYENVILWNDFKTWLQEKGFEVIKKDGNTRDMGNMLLRNRFLT
jgi:FkbM family methyltransferase